MRPYSVDSPNAAGRILALTMIVDGNLAGSELAALDRSKILDHIDLDQVAFQRLLQDLCEDLLTSTLHGAVQLDNALIDSLLEEIEHPDLRRSLLSAMWSIADADGWLADADGWLADADGWLADAEAVLLTRASNAWSAETNFSGPARCDR